MKRIEFTDSLAKIPPLFRTLHFAGRRRAWVSTALALSFICEIGAQTFTAVTEGPVVTDTPTWSVGCAWGDFNNDGLIDLFVANIGQNMAGGGSQNYLYRNNGGGTFTKITAGRIVNDTNSSNGCAWGDYDNDGFLDMFVTNDYGESNALYRNNGDGTFTRITQGRIAIDAGQNEGCAWGDFNNDGALDLFVSSKSGNDFLYQNNGSGAFSHVTTSPVVRDGADTSGCSWGDLDNDGDLDLFVAAFGSKGLLYRNNGDATFAKVTQGPIANDSASSVGGAWGDYDNDGDLDLFVSNLLNQNNWLYRNEGGGNFFKIAEGEIVTDGGHSTGCAWGDFDNDGDLDLIVVNAAGPSFLYQNNGDGTFARVFESRLVEGGGGHQGCAWADYDNDGFLDLFASKINGHNALFRNDAVNGHSWLLVRCVGTKSNRAAIGAKVRVLATIGGKAIWQMREISGGTGYNSQNDLRAHFGLGDASQIQTLRIEWPSGLTQELHQLPAKQILTLTEPAPAAPPSFVATRHLPDGKLLMAIKGEVGRTYNLEISPDLSGWALLQSIRITKTDGMEEVVDENAAGAQVRFYRLVQKP